MINMVNNSDTAKAGHTQALDTCSYQSIYVYMYLEKGPCQSQECAGMYSINTSEFIVHCFELAAITWLSTIFCLLRHK